MPKRAEYLQPRFILTEGPEDAACIRDLMRTRGLVGFEVSPNEDCGSVRGNSGFYKAVIGCETGRNFSAVSEIVLISDNDTAASFQGVVDQISRAKTAGLLARNWGVPVNQSVRFAGDPSVTAWMWPAAGVDGCLETLVWKVLQANYAKECACVDAAMACSSASAWSVSKQDKARVRCFFSLVFKKNPAVTLSTIWNADNDPTLIPTTDAAFDPIYNFLLAL